MSNADTHTAPLDNDAQMLANIEQRIKGYGHIVGIEPVSVHEFTEADITEIKQKFPEVDELLIVGLGNRYEAT